MKKMLENVREQCPLVHNITNYVTVNDCANIILACGGSPIMADDPAEVEQITSICGALNINIGTLNKNTVSAMFLSGKKANQLSRPIILDPVGAGASDLRTNTTMKLLDEIKFSVIRGNISEIKTLAIGSSTTNGVDAAAVDAVTENSIENAIIFIKNFSKKTGAVVVVTGAIDIVANEKDAYVIRNGNPLMSEITGSGCMLTAMTAAYIAANPNDILKATAASVCAMGLCGEKAYKKGIGNSSYRNGLIDEVYNLTADELEEGAKYEM